MLYFDKPLEDGAMRLVRVHVDGHAVFGSGTPLENGKTWWTYGNPPFLEEYNDAVNDGRYREWRGIVEKFINDYARGRDHRGYYFK